MADTKRAETKRAGSKRRDRAAEMAAELAGLAEPTAEPTTAAAKTSRRGRPAKAAGPAARAPRERATAPQAPRERATARRAATPATPARSRVKPMPAETDGRKRYPVRVPMQTDAEQKRALEQARVDDGIQATARLRAMVALWMTDDRVRARVDKLAQSWR